MVGVAGTVAKNSGQKVRRNDRRTCGRLAAVDSLHFFEELHWCVDLAHRTKQCSGQVPAARLVSQRDLDT